MKHIKRLFLWLSFSFFLNAYAQEEKEPMYLNEIFYNIQKKHQVQFNFIEEEVAIFKIIPPNNKLNLRQKLKYITEKTQLNFQFIDAVYISVVNDQKLDKPLCGYLFDKETNEAIEGVYVKIKGTEIATTSNKNGYFELFFKSDKLIEINHLGFETIEISSESIYKTNCPKLFLSPKIQEIQQVNVSTYLTKGITKKNDGTIEIKPKNLGALPGLTEADVLQTLQQIPGITTINESISNINVRGGSHDQNLFTWNKIKLYQTGHFFGLISAINPNLSNKIAISKNGTSAFFSEGVSSNVAISTHDDWIYKSENSIGINMINADFYSRIKTSKTSNLEISGRRSITDFYQSPTYKNYYNRIFQNSTVTNISNNQNLNFSTDENFYFYDFSAQFHQKMGGKSNLYLDFITISNKLELLQSKTENNINSIRNSNLNQNTYGGSLHFKTNWNRHNSTEFTAFASQYKIDALNESITNEQILIQENTILDTGFQLENKHTFNNSFQFSNGYQYNETGIRNVDVINSPNFSRKVKDVLRIHALVLEGKYTSKNKKLQTTLGLRSNYIEQFGLLIIEPRLQLKQQLNSTFFVEVLAEKKHQTSSQIINLQSDFFGVENRRWTQANNSDIPVITSNQASLSLNYKYNRWLITLENFYKKVDGISSRSQGFQNQLEFSRINGSYTIMGSEFLVQKQFKKITTWISYSYTDNKYDFNTYVPSIFPNNFEIKHHFASAIIYDYKKIKLALGGKWFTGKPNTEINSTTPIFSTPGIGEIDYKNPNSSNLNEYLQVNISGSYDFIVGKNGKLNLGFSVQNVLNNATSINKFYKIENNSSINEINTFMLERTPNVFIRYSF
jgi:hypothetical protein